MAQLTGFLLLLALTLVKFSPVVLAHEPIPTTPAPNPLDSHLGVSIPRQTAQVLIDIEVSSDEPSQTKRPEDPSPPWLVTSPYTSQEHLTNLSTLPLTSRLLALALTHLSPVNSSYATTPYQNALNWPTVFQHLESLSMEHNHTWQTTVFYVVEFRSKLKSSIDRDLLSKLDRESHREATASGGLLKYWFGSTSDDEERRNLATCLWRKNEDAVAGGRGPWHKRARTVIPRMYESIDVKGLKLTVEDNFRSWNFEPWTEVSQKT